MHPCHNPRLIREADSLVEAGHDVRVVSPCFSTWHVRMDRRLLAQRRWQLEYVDYRSGSWRRSYRSLSVRSRQRLARQLFRQFKSVRMAVNGYTPAFSELVTLAAREPSDWYIAHTQIALPVAAAAAKRRNARLGFDCEDLLAEVSPTEAEIVRLIERAYLPQCEYVSAPSHAMAERLVRDYGIQDPLVLYNVFPLALGAGLVPPEQRPDRPALRLHWFSQTIGPDRGIQDVIEAVRLLGPGAELHLRGSISPSYRAVIEDLARRHGATDQIRFHAQVPHDDLIGTMHQFDVGLALERPEHTNYALTVTNKLFSYFVAGLAVAATDTPGQREVLTTIPSAGFLYQAGDAQALADGLRPWMDSSAVLRTAQSAAWQAGRNKYCWDLEERSFRARLEEASGDCFSTKVSQAAL